MNSLSQTAKLLKSSCRSPNTINPRSKAIPHYTVITDSGGVVELYISMAEFDRCKRRDGTIRLPDGQIGKIDWSAFSPKNGGISTVSGNYPMVSGNAGVHPGQIKEHMDYLRSMGCGQVDHTKDGDVIFRDKGQRRKVCEALGLFDRRASYDDPQPKHRTRNCRSFIR